MNKKFYAVTGVIFLMLNLALAARSQSALDGFDPNANGLVRAVAAQPDGKILIGGDFTSVSPNGGAAVVRNRLARLNHDGTLDASFDPNVSSSVYCVALQPDGKILLGGLFTSVAGTTRNRIARLEANGTLDTAYDPNANNAVLSIAVQTDGQILAGGDFTSIGGLTRNRIARLAAASGAADALFQADASSSVWSILVRTDGGILVGGAFTTIGGQARLYIARLNPDSTVDAAFNPAANDEVRAIAAQLDGRILAGGKFTSIGGQARGRMARLDPVSGLADSLNPAATSDVRTIAVQADGKILAGGFFTGVNSIGGQSRNYIARLDVATGLADSFDPKASSPVHALVIQAHGKVLVGGQFTTFAPNGGAAVTRNRIALVESDGTLDASFNPAAGDFFSSPVGTAIAIQADGKILLGGRFGTLEPNGGTPVTRNRFARVNPDGTLDIAFDPNIFDGTAEIVHAIAVQADGKIIIGGTFSTLAPNGGGTVTRGNLARLNANGTVDTAFDQNVSSGPSPIAVNAIAVQADGKILIGGNFTALTPSGGPTTTRNRIARLNPDGTLDITFNPNANGTVSAIAVQTDGKILLGGEFTTLEANGAPIAPRNRIARVNADGTLDGSFDPNANNAVSAIAVQADGNILLGGQFTTLAPNGGGTATRSHIARVNANGTLDTTFDPNVSGTIRAIAVQTDGKILLAGVFFTIAPNGGPIFNRNHFARVNVDGTLDIPFDANANNPPYAVAVQQDGKILVGGDFGAIGGQLRRQFARLTNEIAVQHLSVTQTNLTWTHSGAGAELSRVTFEQSVDGVNYTFLGTGTRTGTTSDFTLGGQNLPTGQNIYIRARGFYPTGNQNGSASITESVRNVFLTAAPLVSGTVTYGNAAAPPKYISNATVTGTGSPSVFTTTAAPGGTAGQYTLTGFGSGSYTVSLSKTTGQNGISSLDAARIAQHVSGSVLLTTDSQKVTADVSNNNAISSFDAAQIATFVATGSSAGLAGQWRFFVSPGPTFPVGTSPTSRTYTSVTSSIAGEDYSGLLMGDVSGNWNPTAARTADRRQETGDLSQETDESLKANIAVSLPEISTKNKEITIPVSVQSIANKGVISYECDLRYDPSVIQPLVDVIDLKGTASRGLSVVTNAAEPGLLRVVVYGAYPIDENGVLLNLRFAVVGSTGAVSPLSFERIMFNEGESRVFITNGQIERF
ncbi:MAG: hypothetical protein IPL32_12770 [Chloracidobacterium sp.]|nr:hypothetical protein [Chloracidobacterium sp.]